MWSQTWSYTKSSLWLRLPSTPQKGNTDAHSHNFAKSKFHLWRLIVAETRALPPQNGSVDTRHHNLAKSTLPVVLHYATFSLLVTTVQLHISLHFLSSLVSVLLSVPWIGLCVRFRGFFLQRLRVFAIVYQSFVFCGISGPNQARLEVVIEEDASR